MISEEALRKAAEEANDCLLRSLDAESIPAHHFSARFERKMRRLIRRARHPAAYRALTRAVCVLLALILGSGVFLAVNPEARAAFFGWVRTQYERLFVYDMTSTSEQTDLPVYTLGWLPEGYEESIRYCTPNLTRVVYSNSLGDAIDFLYSNQGNIYINPIDTTTHPATIDGQPAEIYCSENANENNNIVWSTAKPIIVFEISGKFDEDILIYMAENVKPS